MTLVAEALSAQVSPGIIGWARTTAGHRLGARGSRGQGLSLVPPVSQREANLPRTLPEAHALVH